MADDDKRLDLVARLAEKKPGGDRSLAERAAEVLSRAKPAAQPKPAAAPAEAKPARPQSESQPTPPPPRAAPESGGVDAQPAPPPPAQEKHVVDDDAEAPSAPAGKPNGAGARPARNFAAIDLVRLQLAGYITPNSQQTRTAEEFRTIKRPLLLNAYATGDKAIRRGNVILVTSAKPSEGKTFTAVNLAMSIASERDLHVLLIDTDVYKRGINSVLGIESERGLVDLLVDESLSLPDLLIRTNISNLTVLPVGMRHPQAPELLASQRMAAIMEDLARRYPDRIIIIDAPPVLASSEPGVLALLVGQIVMVVESEATDRQSLSAALSLISNCQNISFVLNKADIYLGSSQYGAYTYYDDYRKRV